ncbi:PepSY domain-containing protein [Marinactinospora thermotolerans]|uniref:Uncharacterized membrane protein YkoI n=1 Tax=Marinactinospora thermotolerans DSM 45154 TaxID=1122192 RepID=A0A1T4SNY6_9ACTN|nr:PepSY domain-containing protein [Marinactinospora thermotolerans]SKA30014.1 Uncharacterized membrane protein YkoI [Marinactinospora thermotolerans DSM 45154]
MRGARNTRTGLVGAAVLALTLLGGCGDDDTADQTPQATPTAGAEDTTGAAQTPGGSPSPGGGVDILAAAQKALEQYPEGRVQEIELEDGREWRVDLIEGRNGHRVVVDASTGAVTENDEDPFTAPDKAHTPDISLEQAVDAALAETGGGRATGAEIDSEDGGLLVWQVEVDDDVTVDVNAGNGEVVERDS